MLCYEVSAWRIYRNRLSREYIVSVYDIVRVECRRTVNMANLCLNMKENK